MSTQAKNKAQRPFNPEVIDKYVVADLGPEIGIGTHAWKFTLLVPVEQITLNRSIEKATAEDLDALSDMLCSHCNGITFLQFQIGGGLRNQRDPNSLELNRHFPFVVYAKAIEPSNAYFSAIQRELQAALCEGLVLIERQDVYLPGRSDSWESNKALGTIQVPALESAEATRSIES